jgi:hypothetical protein
MNGSREKGRSGAAGCCYCGYDDFGVTSSSVMVRMRMVTKNNDVGCGVRRRSNTKRERRTTNEQILEQTYLLLHCKRRIDPGSSGGCRL